MREEWTASPICNDALLLKSRLDHLGDHDLHRDTVSTSVLGNSFGLSCEPPNKEDGLIRGEIYYRQPSSRAQGAMQAGVQFLRMRDVMVDSSHIDRIATGLRQIGVIFATFDNGDILKCSVHHGVTDLVQAFRVKLIDEDMARRADTLGHPQGHFAPAGSDLSDYCAGSHRKQLCQTYSFRLEATCLLSVYGQCRSRYEDDRDSCNQPLILFEKSPAHSSPRSGIGSIVYEERVQPPEVVIKQKGLRRDKLLSWIGWRICTSAPPPDVCLSSDLAR